MNSHELVARLQGRRRTQGSASVRWAALSPSIGQCAAARGGPGGGARAAAGRGAAASTACMGRTRLPTPTTRSGRCATGCGQARCRLRRRSTGRRGTRSWSRSPRSRLARARWPASSSACSAPAWPRPQPRSWPVTSPASSMAIARRRRRCRAGSCRLWRAVRSRRAGSSGRAGSWSWPTRPVWRRRRWPPSASPATGAHGGWHGCSWPPSRWAGRRSAAGSTAWWRCPSR